MQAELKNLSVDLVVCRSISNRRQADALADELIDVLDDVLLEGTFSVPTKRGGADTRHLIEITAAPILGEELTWTHAMGLITRLQKLRGFAGCDVFGTACLGGA